MARLVARPLFWVATVAVLAAVPLGSGLLRRPPPPPPILGTLPPFQLTAPGGERLDREALAGRVWLLGFADQGCVPCVEQLGSAMERLQYRLRNVGQAAGLLTVAVPGRAEVVDLTGEAARHHANPRQWRVAGGPGALPLLAAVRALRPDRAAMPDAGAAVALVDTHGRVRAVEGIERREDSDRLLAQLTLLLNLR
ncbi:MAG TPA: hypothetical protein VK454_04930 [Myxococcaceae bacterium]|nr:hypothetical protein [Myxococcaceae bacterium]